MLPAIKVENISKLYNLGSLQRGYKTFREAMVDTASAPIRWVKGERRSRPEQIWALKDVSFEIQPGEVVGIIGRNGAGKTTLLKILSKITEPTTGRAEIRGRVGSLLEVGTGFHPELTGRENIYMNGSILGMRKAEIDRKFDEIVAFAEIEKFLDTPVKRYSSGMYVRLAFAVAAHLEPEILLVDEVLAVGDAGFQKKCIGKMQDVGKEGRTVLFVSHNMALIQNLCKTGILFALGEVQLMSSVDEVVKAYLSRVSRGMAISDLRSVKRKVSSDNAKIISCALYSNNMELVSEIQSGQPLIIRIGYEALRFVPGSYLSVQIYRYDYVPVFAFYSHRDGLDLKADSKPQTVEVRIGELTLFPSTYSIKIGICNPNDQLDDFVDPAITFDVIPGERTYHNFSNPNTGLVDIPVHWRQL